MEDHGSDFSDNDLDFEDFFDFASPKKRSYSEVDCPTVNHTYEVLPDTISSNPCNHEDTSPWEIFPIDQWAKVQILGRIADSRKVLTPETHRTRSTDGINSMKVVYDACEEGTSLKKRRMNDDKSMLSSDARIEHNKMPAVALAPVSVASLLRQPEASDVPSRPKNMKEWSQLFKQSSELYSAITSKNDSCRDYKKAELVQVYMLLQSAGEALGVNEILIGHVTEKLNVLFPTRS
mmetsp:Transcript_21116/g.30527  ORF Transcript_21116/g.30527 Transcript_21116/m.30527 type:complete len:235 (-) Transcript_21116:121-825(-)|eukprot:CAMPEP_0185035372 /NCGR_PEP_ID=MMETSP1103-20130426/26603_1 /TAXON_ID=36769 /ORGANISM="Paraphysomonas bandaiensis, Strain Caron Lab Isolate" /LENGTH=234 /DNA_ID=CAMNT_0027572413 /DNA_START=96 /DNA_END=800 /DNA_ORIENTATION=-